MKALLFNLLFCFSLSAQNWAVWHVGINTNGIPTNRVEMAEYIGADVACTNGCDAVMTRDEWRTPMVFLRFMGGLIGQDKVTNLVTDLIGKANVAHGHSAADISSGVISPDRLASGSALQVVRRNAANTALEFATPAGVGDALTINPLSQFASTTSAQLLGVINNETGSGALVFGTSPVITTPTGIVKGDVGLGNVDNTSDAAKPVSSTQQTALDLKASLASPTFTGTPTLPVASVGVTHVVNDNTTKLSTTAYVDRKLTVKASTVNVTNATTTAAKITSLDTTTSTGTFAFQYFLLYRSGAVTNGVKFSVNHSGTLTSFVCNMRYGSTGGAAATAAATQAGNTATGNIHESFTARVKSATANMGPTVSSDVVNADMLVILEGVMVVTVSGDIQLYHASETAAATGTYVMKDSVLILTKAL